MTIRRFPLADGRAPLEAPEPDAVIQSSIGLFERFRGQISKKTDSQLVRRVLGCDGRSVVTAYRGDCQDDARAINGGGAALGVDLGNGVIVPVASDLGRSYVASSGYQGDGLMAGAFPAPTAPTAVDLALDPIDQAGGVVISGEAADAGAARAGALGAAVAGKTGDSKRLAVCYGGGGAGVWDNVLTGTETAITGLSIDPNYICAMGGDQYALTKLYDATVSLTDAGAEASTTALPPFGTPPPYAYSAPALSRDLDTMAVLAYASGNCCGVYIGTSMLTAPSWAVLNLGVTPYGFQVYGTRALAFGEDGTLFVAAHLIATSNPVILVIQAPYLSLTQVLVPSWLGSSGASQWNDPSPLAISRDGRYMASGNHGAADGSSGVADIWSLAARTRSRTLVPSGYMLSDGTNEQGYGGLAFGPDGRLFAILKKTADGSFHLGVWEPPFSAAAEIISLSMASRPLFLDWLSVSGDGQVVAVKGDAAGEIILVEPPYTGAGATVTPLTMSGNVAYQFEFDPSEAYLDADMALSADVTTADVGGQLQSTIRLDYRNEDVLDAFGVTVTLPVAGRSVVSVSGDGIYDSEAEVITWFFPALGVGASGYVTAVLVAR